MKVKWRSRMLGVLALAVTLIAGLASADQVFAQAGDVSSDGIWQAVDVGGAAVGAAAVPDGPSDFRVFAANTDALQATLARAPQEAEVVQAEAVILSVPMPDGTFQRFQIAEYSMMDASLSASLPNVATYLGWGLDDTTATARLIWTSSGFNGMILTDEGISYVDGINVDAGIYRSYHESALPREEWSEVLERNEAVDDLAVEAAHMEAPAAVNVGERLHVYRLAVAATGEFTQKYGSKQATKEGIGTIVNQLNGLFERDVAVRFVLVDNDAIIFENATTDPYSTPVNFTAIGQQLGQNQQTLDAVLGSAAYDVGHVFGIGGGGIGGSGPCLADSKARAATNTGNPQSPGWITGLLAHEVAHQFTASHSFNGACSIEGNPTRSENGAYEPGSGSTVMSYGGVCAPQNIVSTPDSYFHAISIQQITAYVTNPQTGGSCGTHNLSGNAVPVVNAGADATIPAGTPFKLVGSATDANNDSLTYTWEQMDRGSAWTDANNPVLPNRDQGDNPIFRSYPPSAGSTRYLPDTTNPANAIGESLPTQNRQLNFRLTVRDGKGGVGSDDKRITVNAAAGPFVLTAPTAGTFWTPNAQQQVSWNVANTNQAPISCSSVNILASSDGGNNFVTLKANTPNDGNESVTAPASGTILLKIECAGAGQIFYALSTQPGVRVCTPILQDNHEDGAAGWTVGGPPNPPTSNYKQWVLRTDGGFSGANFWFVDNDRNQQYTTLDSQQVTATSDKVTLSFVHKYQFFSLTNQIGKVQIKVNGGDWQDLAGYTDGQAAYAETQIDLTGRVKNGDTFQVRFRRENNSNSWMILSGPNGWSLDDVLICASATQAPPVEPPVVPDTGDRTWTGASSTDWGNAANWSPAAVPTAQNNAVIPAGLATYPTINGNFAVNSMLIAGGATVNMTGGELTVQGNWGQTTNTGGQPIEVCRAFGAGEGQVNQQKTFGPNSVEDILNVSSGSPIADLDVFMDVSHPWVGDITASLQHVETGTTVEIFNPSNDNCFGDNFAFSLDDEATTAVAGACVNANPSYPGNRYQPNNALSAFDGQLSAGQWKLTLNDIYPSADDGRLNRWCVNITPVNSGGVFNGTGGTVVFGGAQTQVVRMGDGSRFNHVQIGDNNSSQQVRLTNAVDVNGNVVIAGNAVLDGGSGTINVAGNWQQSASASFVPGTSSVIFDGANQSASLGAAGTVQPINFNILAVNAGSTVDFGYASPQVAQQLVNNGTLRRTADLGAGSTQQFFASGGYGGVTMATQGGAPGTTIVSISKQVNGCTAKVGETVQRCIDINPQNKAGLNATLTFFYAESEQAGNTCTFMNAYQNDLSGTELPELAVSDNGRACTGPLRSITVNGVNNFNTTAFTLGSDVGGDNKRADDPPIAVNDEAVFVVGQEEYEITVLLNDFDPEGGDITLDFVGSAEHGEATEDRRVIKYKPDAGFTGVDTFTYEISDVGGQSATATVNVRMVEAPVSDVYLPLITR